MNTPQHVIGIDPGARTTAIIIIDTNCNPRKLSLIKNDGDLLPLPTSYITDIITEIHAYLKEYSHATVAIEGINRPSWHVASNHKRGSAADPTGLLGTAMILGALLSHFPDATIVQPNKNGSKTLGEYPLELSSPQERKHTDWQIRIGTGKLRHARSAYDIASTIFDQQPPNISM